MNRFHRLIARLLVVSLAGLGLPLPAQAGMVPTESAVTGAERARVAEFLDRQDVQVQLQARGVSADEVKARVAALTDEEASQMASRIDGLPAGGDVLGILLTVFIVLLITDILGFTKVFPFTRPIR
jgi:hypothetical protein